MNRLAAKTLLTLLSLAVMLAVLIPLLHFVVLSFLSGQEAYRFPQPLLPSFTLKVKVDAGVDNVRKISYYNSQERDYTLVLETNRVQDIRRYFARELSVKLSAEQIENDLLRPSLAQGPFLKSYRKNLLYNYQSFFVVVERAFPALLNSLKVAFYTIIISLSIGSTAGYAFARYQFFCKKQLLLSLLLVRMFPSVVISLSLLLLLSKVGLYDSLLGLAIAYSVPNIALSAWITNSIFRGIPVSVEEAAQVCGASKLRTVLTVTLPLALPALAASSLYAFLSAWNDTIVALLLTQNQQTYALAIYRVIGGGSVDIQFLAAGAMVLVLPALVFTFVIRRYATQLWGGVSL